MSEELRNMKNFIYVQIPLWEHQSIWKMSNYYFNCKTIIMRNHKNKREFKSYFFVCKDKYNQVKDADFMKVCLRIWMLIPLSIYWFHLEVIKTKFSGKLITRIY